MLVYALEEVGGGGSVEAIQHSVHERQKKKPFLRDSLLNKDKWLYPPNLHAIFEKKNRL